MSARGCERKARGILKGRKLLPVASAIVFGEREKAIIQTRGHLENFHLPGASDHLASSSYYFLFLLEGATV